MRYIILSLLLLCGCQWSSYNSYDYVDGLKTTETHVGTIEFFVLDSKKGLSVELADGTTLGLAQTGTEVDEQAVMMIIEAIDQWLSIAKPYGD